MNFSNLKQQFMKLSTHREVFKAVVNAPFENVLYTTGLGLGVVVLLLVNKKNSTLDRVALSETEFAKGAVKYSVKPFHEIKIPLTYHENLLIKAIDSGVAQRTEDWRFMFEPALTAEEARFNQAGAGIASSAIFPLSHSDGEVFGAMIYSYYEPIDNLGDEHEEFMKQYAAIVSETLYAKIIVSES